MCKLSIPMLGYRCLICLILTLSSNTAGALSLQYRLTMLGYSDQEIKTIVSKSQSFRTINLRYKMRLLGYPPTPSPTVSLGRTSEKTGHANETRHAFVPHATPLLPDHDPRVAKGANLLAEAGPYLPIIKEAAVQNDLARGLLLAVIKVESDFDAQALSKKGAMGLMQLMPGTAIDLGISDPFDPEQNILGGARYLSECVRTFKDLELALAAYNAGPSRVAKLNRIPNIHETQTYVKDIIYYKNVYDHLFGRKSDHD